MRSEISGGVKSDDQVAVADVHPLLQHIRGHQHVQLSVTELLKCLFLLLVGQFSLLLFPWMCWIVVADQKVNFQMSKFLGLPLDNCFQKSLKFDEKNVKKIF